MVRSTPLVIALLMIGTVGTAGVVADGTFISMTAQPVPDQPTADSEFAVDVHFESTGDNGDIYDIESVRVYDVTGDTKDRLETRDSAPALAPGDSRTVTLEGIQFDTPGVYELRVEADLESGGTTTTIDSQVIVEVSGAEPAIGVAVEPAQAGAWRSLNLTLANRANTSVRGITVGVDGEALQVRQSERVVSSLSTGEERTLAFDVQSGRLGRHDVDISLSYREPSGGIRSVERTVAVNFTRPDTITEARLTDVNVTAVQTGLRIEGAIVNDGTTQIEGLSIAVADAEGVVPTAPSPESFVGSVDAASRRSFTVTTSIDADRTTIPLSISYRVDGVEHTTREEIAYDGARSVDAVEVTDLSVTPSAAGVRINGSVAGVGSQDATRVSVAVRDEPGVQPASPRSTAFVGDVSRGTSAPFVVTAALESNRETIPLSVTYTVDGVTYTTRETIPYDGAIEVPPLELTGVSASPTASGIELEGSAANVGSRPLDAVIVAVGDAAGVQPTAPQPEYFVGTVEASDFSSFSVTASVEGNRSTVPLTVTYRIDGRTYELTKSVSVAAQPSRDLPRKPPNQGGGFPIVPALVAVVVIGIAAVAYRRLR